MNHHHYLSRVQQQLSTSGFDLLEAPGDLRLSLTMERPQGWGRLLLAVAPPGLTESSDREGLVGALAAWVSQLQESDHRRTYAILVFPFTQAVPDEVLAAIKAMRREDPDERWGVMPWTLDLDVELVDQHLGFPRVGVEVARALTEVERGVPEAVWRQASGSRIGSTGTIVRRLGDVPATRLILAATVATYVWVLSASGWNGLVAGPPLRALIQWGANHGQLVLVEGERWRLLTHLLLHGGLMHLGFNMWALWNVGRHVEMIYGSAQMSFIYWTAGIAGGIASTVLRPNFVTSVGASGAVLGLMGALLYFALALRGRSVDWRAVLGPVAINLFYGFLWSGIDNYAHVGGFAGGFLAAFVAGIPGERGRWRTWTMSGIALALLLTLAGVTPLPHLPLFR